MRSIATGLMWVLVGAMPVSATELPARKPGLWEVKTSIGNNIAAARSIQQCIDAATDQMLQSNAGPFAAAACPQREVKNTADSITIDSTCTLGGKAATAHAVITGSFDSAYTMTVTSQNDELPGGKMTMTMDAKWLGPCAADQKPGDLIMGNGVKVNILQMQKLSTQPSIPPPPK